MRRTKKQKLLWERTHQIPFLVEKAIRPLFSRKKKEQLPPRAQLEAGMRLRMRDNFRWNQVDFKWPDDDMALAELLMEKEDRLFLTVVVRPYKAKRMEIPFTTARLGLIVLGEEEPYYQSVEDYPDDSDSCYDSQTLEPVDGGYDNAIEDELQRGLTRRERQMEDWEWEFAKRWLRGKGA